MWKSGLHNSISQNYSVLETLLSPREALSGTSLLQIQCMALQKVQLIPVPGDCPLPKARQKELGFPLLLPHSLIRLSHSFSLRKGVRQLEKAGGLYLPMELPPYDQRKSEIEKK